MREVSERVLSYLKDGEIIIYEVEDIVDLEVKGMLNKDLKEKRMFISNYGNIYFYFYFGKEGLKDQIYYYSQLDVPKTIKYGDENGVALCRIENFLVKTKDGGIRPISTANATLRLPIKDIESISSKLSITLFQLGNTESTKEMDEVEITPEEILRAKDIFKIYGNNKEEIAALNGVSLVVNKGDFISIMGPSGSGKSTLINMLSTIDGPTRGAVLYMGKNLLSMNEREISKYRYENLGFIFQDYNLIDNLTIKENIAVPLILAAIPQKEILERINKIAERLDIEKILNKYPAECSGGQCQRASCARALVTNPQIIVADEPTGNLDTKNSHELLRMIQDLNSKEGITVIMVTHDNMIASYSKKILFIRDGKIDEIIEKGTDTQKKYFYKIVEVASRDSQNLIDNIIGG